jgi:hypothetical protein
MSVSAPWSTGGPRARESLPCPAPRPEPRLSRIRACPDHLPAGAKGEARPGLKIIQSLSESGHSGQGMHTPLSFSEKKKEKNQRISYNILFLFEKG